MTRNRFRFSPRRALMLVGVVTALLAGTSAAAPPASADDPYVLATSAAARGDHATAAARFERAIAEDGWSANALLGLGNAYASLGDHGRAILAYERARLLAPRDAAIANNLRHVRESAGLAAPSVSLVDRTTGSLTANQWALIAFGGFALACAGTIMIAWSARRRRLGWVAGLAGTVIAIGAGGIAREVAPDPATAIVITTEGARIAPFPAADVVFTAPAGETVHIEERRGDHVYIRVDDERAGWLPETAIERVVPTDRGASRA